MRFYKFRYQNITNEHTDSENLNILSRNIKKIKNVCSVVGLLRRFFFKPIFSIEKNKYEIFSYRYSLRKYVVPM